MKRGSKPPLSEKHQRFVEEYLIDLNATQAAIRAGYSEKTAYAQGSALLKHVEVKKAISAAKKARAERMAISQDRVLLELARIAYFDIRKTVDKNGAPIPIEQLDDDTAAAIGGIDVLEQFEMMDGERVPVGLLKKYKVFDKNTALANAMRHLGMLKDSLKVDLPAGGSLVKVMFVDAPAQSNPAPGAAQSEGEANG
jgi:phage terminase small subunit